MNLTIRARLTLLYFIVLAASFVAFFWICDFGFRRSIEITVNDASRTNLERVRAVIEKALPGAFRRLATSSRSSLTFGRAAPFSR